MARNESRSQEIFKVSGCRKKMAVSKKTGETFECITGWNKSKRRGFISFVACARKDPKIRKTRNPDWENWHVNVQFADGAKSFNGLHDLRTGKLIIPDLQMVANPNTPSGRTRGGKMASGYFGTYIKRN